MQKIMFMPGRDSCYFGTASNSKYPVISKEAKELVDLIKKSAEESGNVEIIDQTCKLLRMNDSLSCVLEVLEGGAEITLDYIPGQDWWQRELEKGDYAIAYPNTVVEIKPNKEFKAKVYRASTPRHIDSHRED
tara:strand:- start:2861 stop:3259 length:399 start_codon:yes stop_codon:yes gene_type:complete